LAISISDLPTGLVKLVFVKQDYKYYLAIMGHIIVSLVNIIKPENSHIFNIDYYQK